MTPTGYFLDHLWLIPLFPLATAALMLFFGRRLPNAAVGVLCVGSVGLSFVYAAGAVFQLLAADPEHRVAQQILFESYLLPFEIASVLLLVAMIGAVVMAKKRT